jgi:hypothetical protein
MKLPRWLVISLLSTCSLGTMALVGIAASWWVSWPEVTAREFAELLVARQFEEASRLVDCEPSRAGDMTLYDLQSNTKHWLNATLDRRERTAFDIIFGRQICQVRSDYTISSGKPVGPGPHPELETGLRFVVGRGRITAVKGMDVLINQGGKPSEIRVVERRINGFIDVIDSSWNSSPIVRDSRLSP